ncbi:MAG: hypothetical protein E4H14_13800 [Candidatus Thorarchaeota archaeon]|nr:MAG: hypothetical protein E4H14_13800 [Candidatus Thorarchaeota archaeon]
MVQENASTLQQDSDTWTPIVQFKREIHWVNVRFNIIKKGKTRIVTQRSTGRKHEISDCIVGDSTAIVNLTLWNDDIDVIEQGKTYELQNGYINLFDECMILSKGRRGSIVESSIMITTVNGQIDMSRPFMGKPIRRKKQRSQTGRSLSGAAGRETKGFCSRKSF